MKARTRQAAEPLNAEAKSSSEIEIDKNAANAVDVPAAAAQPAEGWPIYCGWHSTEHEYPAFKVSEGPMPNAIEFAWMAFNPRRSRWRSLSIQSMLVYRILLDCGPNIQKAEIDEHGQAWVRLSPYGPRPAPTHDELAKMLPGKMPDGSCSPRSVSRWIVELERGDLLRTRRMPGPDPGSGCRTEYRIRIPSMVIEAYRQRLAAKADAAAAKASQAVETATGPDRPTGQTEAPNRTESVSNRTALSGSRSSIPRQTDTNHGRGDARAFMDGAANATGPAGPDPATDGRSQVNPTDRTGPTKADRIEAASAALLAHELGRAGPDPAVESSRDLNRRFIEAFRKRTGSDPTQADLKAIIRQGLGADAAEAKQAALAALGAFGVRGPNVHRLLSSHPPDAIVDAIRRCEKHRLRAGGLVRWLLHGGEPPEISGKRQASRSSR